jgi:hypothetical protein
MKIRVQYKLHTSLDEGKIGGEKNGY